jgi:hypothetical protein
MHSEFTESQQNQIKLVATDIYRYNHYYLAYATLKKCDVDNSEKLVEHVTKLD